MKTEKLNIEGMSCGHCTMTVEGALLRMGIKGKANLKTNSVQFEYDEEKTNLDEIKKNLSATGYLVQ